MYIKCDKCNDIKHAKIISLHLSHFYMFLNLAYNCMLTNY